MSDSPPIRRAIAVSSKRASNPTLHKLTDLLGHAQIPLAIHASGAEAAAAVLVAPEDQPYDCVFVDGSDGAFRKADLDELRDTVPHLAPLVIASAGPASDMVLEAFRAGAFDVIELDRVNDAELLHAVDRAAAESHQRKLRRTQVSELRQMVEEFLRVLVRAERRSIDLEDQLRIARGQTNNDEGDRPATVLVVDDDDDVLDMLLEVLTKEGMKVVTSETGEGAVEEVRQGVEWREPVDLIVLDKNLPDIDGFEVINRIRALTDSPPPILMMTGYASQESAIGAADLGVVGYVLKPFEDVAALVRRIKDAASRAGTDRRERKYLSRIKDRHAEFLLRYRRLAAQLDKLR